MTGELTYAAETMAAEVVPVPFLIDTLKRLEIAVTQTKQNTDVISNRYKNGALFDAVRPGSFGTGQCFTIKRPGLKKLLDEVRRRQTRTTYNSLRDE
jgi:hypothetical protein